MSRLTHVFCGLSDRRPVPWPSCCDALVAGHKNTTRESSVRFCHDLLSETSVNGNDKQKTRTRTSTHGCVQIPRRWSVALFLTPPLLPFHFKPFWKWHLNVFAQPRLGLRLFSHLRMQLPRTRNQRRPLEQSNPQCSRLSRASFLFLRADLASNVHHTVLTSSSSKPDRSQGTHFTHQNQGWGPLTVTELKYPLQQTFNLLLQIGYGFFYWRVFFSVLKDFIIIAFMFYVFLAFLVFCPSTRGNVSPVWHRKTKKTKKTHTTAVFCATDATFTKSAYVFLIILFAWVFLWCPESFENHIYLFFMPTLSLSKIISCLNKE